MFQRMWLQSQLIAPGERVAGEVEGCKLAILIPSHPVFIFSDSYSYRIDGALKFWTYYVVFGVALAIDLF